MVRVVRLGAALLVGLVAAVVWLAPAADADCPAGLWGCPGEGFAAHRAGPPGGERVVVIGDSLVQQAGALPADRLAAAGFTAFTVGASGFAYHHWNIGLAEGLDIGDYVRRERADHVILALGTNDARVLARKPPVVTVADVDVRLRWGAAEALAATRGCVVLVVPTTRSHAPQARVVAGLVRELAATSPRYVVADWAARSGGHESWFVAPGNVHLSAAGNAAYATFLARWAEAARSGAPGC